MNLRELLEVVKDENLGQRQLESYRDDLIHLHSSMQLRAAELEKQEARFFMASHLDTDIATKRAWRVTDAGQELISLNRELKAIVKEIDSLKSRIYSLL